MHKQVRTSVSRRDVFRTGAVATAGLTVGPAAEGATTKATGPDPYTRIGVRPFINCTATITINGGSLTLPEVVSTIEQGSHYHVNLNELMEKVGDRLAQLLQVEWGIVTAGAASSLMHATAGCIAGADYLIVPNPYIALGADLVAYSGGKIIRGPQTAGLLVGRRDLVRAAWANSAPHHTVGRPAKVSKEEIVGMLRAVEVWRTERDVLADFKIWESWYADIAEQITKVP